MEQIILIVHVLAAMGIIGLIMIQQGKGADMGASFGAGASQTLFGSSGSGNVLTKGTAILATLFFATSFALAVVAKNKAVSVADLDIPVVVENKEMPAVQAPIGDIPQGDVEAVEAALEAGGFDIPAIDSATVSDIPQ